MEPQAHINSLGCAPGRTPTQGARPGGVTRPRSHAGAERGGEPPRHRGAHQRVVDRRGLVQDLQGDGQLQGPGVVGTGRGVDAAVQLDRRRQLGERHVDDRRVGHGHHDLAQVDRLVAGVRQGPSGDAHRGADGHHLARHGAGVGQVDRRRLRRTGDQVAERQRSADAGDLGAGVGTAVDLNGRREVGADGAAARNQRDAEGDGRGRQGCGDEGLDATARLAGLGACGQFGRGHGSVPFLRLYRN